MYSYTVVVFFSYQIGMTHCTLLLSLCCTQTVHWIQFYTVGWTKTSGAISAVPWRLCSKGSIMNKVRGRATNQIQPAWWWNPEGGPRLPLWKALLRNNPGRSFIPYNTKLPYCPRNSILLSYERIQSYTNVNKLLLWLLKNGVLTREIFPEYICYFKFKFKFWNNILY